MQPHIQQGPRGTRLTAFCLISFQLYDWMHIYKEISAYLHTPELKTAFSPANIVLLSHWAQHTASKPDKNQFPMALGHRLSRSPQRFRQTAPLRPRGAGWLLCWAHLLLLLLQSADRATPGHSRGPWKDLHSGHKTHADTGLCAQVCIRQKLK